MLKRHRFANFVIKKCLYRKTFIFICCTAAFIGGHFFAILNADVSECNTVKCNRNHEVAFKYDNSWLSHFINSEQKIKYAFLVIVILSAPSNFRQREVIRQTWIGDEGDDVLHFFIIGTEGIMEDENITIESEQKRFKDLLFLSNIYDSYQALTKKVLASFIYLSKNANFRFLLKCDDDTFVNLIQLDRELRSLTHTEKLYWGFFDGRATPKRSGVWKEEEWILCDHYLPYAVGGGYILSSDLVTYIALNAKYLRLFSNEDVSVGTWLAPLDIYRKHDPRFDTEYKSRGCNNNYLVSHKQNIFNMRDKYNSLQSIGLLCQKQFQVRKSYIYNWKVPPSNCCIRNDTSVP